ncbi:protein CHLOROPLAST VESICULATION [Vicia villosa]|uniref:protein CHLOROPLAST VESICULATION n=1 Tax=Vicia villosa TaxID=3911 RepID=UPI00273CD547|nr:protein CHLOROPLAST VESICULATION [Vicia villosa]
MRSTSCCLRLYPTPTSKASLIPSNPPQLSLEKNRGSWKRPCVVIGVASCFTIIGLQFNSSVISGHEVVVVPKEEIMVMTMSNSIDDDDYDDEYDEHEHVVLVGGVAKWSQKRMCPSWQGNNPLETIVPENLPRPAARRRYEAVRSDSKTAPPLSLSSVKLKTSRGDCFSM